jgi:hypothetical protein
MTRRTTLDLGDGLRLPVEAVTQTFAILAKRGRDYLSALRRNGLIRVDGSTITPGEAFDIIAMGGR